MRPWLCRLAILLLPLLASVASRGSPLGFDFGGDDRPSLLESINPPRGCTVTYLVQDIVTNDTFAARMQFNPTYNAIPRNGRLPCPSLVPTAVAENALDLCRGHAAKRADCVFADMRRGFQSAPLVANSTEITSRCASDEASQIAIACWNSGGSQVCNVGCGEDQAGAIAVARKRCEATHQKACGITGVLPVSAP